MALCYLELKLDCFSASNKKPQCQPFIEKCLTFVQCYPINQGVSKEILRGNPLYVLIKISGNYLQLSTLKENGSYYNRTKSMLWKPF